MQNRSRAATVTRTKIRPLPVATSTRAPDLVCVVEREPQRQRRATQVHSGILSASHPAATQDGPPWSRRRPRSDRTDQANHLVVAGRSPSVKGRCTSLLAVTSRPYVRAARGPGTCSVGAVRMGRRTGRVDYDLPRVHRDHFAAPGTEGGAGARGTTSRAPTPGVRSRSRPPTCARSRRRAEAPAGRSTVGSGLRAGDLRERRGRRERPAMVAVLSLGWRSVSCCCWHFIPRFEAFLTRTG